MSNRQSIIIFLIIICLNISIQNRPDLSARKFTSQKVDKYIEEVKPKFKDQALSKIYENCFPNTLDTTINYNSEQNDTFIITGDIHAMWLRDSSFQIYPYLNFAKNDENLKKMMLSLIKRQTKSIIIDPYANAFNKGESWSPWQGDVTYKIENGKRVPAMNNRLWERKYELDSTVSTLFFAFNFFNKTGDVSFIDHDWVEALDKIIELVKNQMKGTDEESESGGAQYTFQRVSSEPSESLHQSVGSPAISCNLVKTSFRNSDDAVVFAYNIPENAFLVSTFEKIVSMLDYALKHNILILAPTEKSRINALSNDLSAIAKTVKTAIYKEGVIIDPITKETFFAYEVDCYGSYYFMDDPGYPSLMSLPFFDFIDNEDILFVNTKKRILSKKNPYYFSINVNGKLIEGLGSSHSERKYVWPLFTIMRILTSKDDAEINSSLQLLIDSAHSTGFMHESFNINNFESFTRPWFAWANSFFGYMINDLIDRKPYLIFK